MKRWYSLSNKRIEGEFQRACRKTDGRNTWTLHMLIRISDNIPEGYEVPEGRVKPWGTAHAVLQLYG